MTPQLLRAADRVPRPWKNGGGVTREVAAWPPGAGLDDFAWRVSMAEVREPGPFSAYPGVDRILAVLNGRLRLRLGQDAALTLTADSPPLAFSGDTPADAAPEGGSVADLNVMTRRGVFTAAVERLPRDELTITAGGAMVVALTECEISGEGARTILHEHDAVFLPSDAPPALVRGQGYLIRLFAAADAPASRQR